MKIELNNNQMKYILDASLAFVQIRSEEKTKEQGHVKTLIHSQLFALFLPKKENSVVKEPTNEVLHLKPTSKK